MREYIAIDDKALKKSTRIAAVAGGTALIMLAVFIHSLYTGLVGVVLLAAMMLNKKVAVTDEGLVVTYDVVFYKYYEKWDFEEIKEIHRELSPDGRRYALHIMKDVMSRRLVYSVTDAEKVIDLALEKNPCIHVADVD
ncbi:MAG: hypothetical protein ACI4LP_11995 [Anaerovoracaceae bacterium]